MTEARALTDSEQLVASAWLRAGGYGADFRDAVHPDDDMYRTIRDYPVPPEEYRLRYFLHGEEGARALRHALRLAGPPLAERRRVLEFACGYGRTTRFLARDVRPERLYTSDILAEAVDFVVRTWGTQGFVSTTRPEELRFPADFDAIWVGSLFSHLPRPRFEGWLAKLHGALAPGGVLLFTTHAWDALPSGARAADAGDGFAFLRQSESARLDLAEYGATYARPPVVAEIAARCGVRHLYRVERDLWTQQDLYAATAGPCAALERWSSTPTVRGAIEKLERQPQHLWIGGWAEAVASDSPLREIRLLFDGQDACGVQLGPVIVREPARPRRDARCVQEWYVEGPLPALPPGLHTLAAVAVTASGERQCFAVRLLPGGGSA